jgi:hypothetical protein
MELVKHVAAGALGTLLGIAMFVAVMLTLLV